MSEPKQDPLFNPWTAWMNPGAAATGMNPFAGMPMLGGGTPDVAQFMKALDPAEIERKIHEMQAVEMWLQTQLTVVQMTTKMLTMQKQSMEALHTAARNAESITAAASASAPKPRKKP